MSLAFTHDQTIARPASIQRAPARRSAVDLVFILAFVTLAIISLLAVVGQPSSAETDSAITTFARL